MDIGDLIRKSWDQNDPTGWFEEVYSRAAEGEGRVPWAKMQPDPEMVAWLDSEAINGEGKQAIVVGCGLGDDAEGLAARGFAVMAFDVSDSAIDWCRKRFPETTVNYQVADLLNLPEDWYGAFDFIMENRTVQALPYDLHQQAIKSIAALLKPGGTALVLCHGRDVEEPATGIPWPLSRRELQVFGENGLTEQQFDDYSKNGLRRFRVIYSR